MKKQSLKQVLNTIKQDIDWNNYIDDNEKHWKIKEVLFSKLEYVKECLICDDSKDENIETIEFVQKIIETI